MTKQISPPPSSLQAPKKTKVLERSQDQAAQGDCRLRFQLKERNGGGVKPPADPSRGARRGSCSHWVLLKGQEHPPAPPAAEGLLAAAPSRTSLYPKPKQRQKP